MCLKPRHTVAAVFENRDFCDSKFICQYGLLVMWKWLKISRNDFYNPANILKISLQFHSAGNMDYYKFHSNVNLSHVLSWITFSIM